MYRVPVVVCIVALLVSCAPVSLPMEETPQPASEHVTKIITSQEQTSPDSKELALRFMEALLAWDIEEMKQMSLSGEVVPSWGINNLDGTPRVVDVGPRIEDGSLRQATSMAGLPVYGQWQCDALAKAQGYWYRFSITLAQDSMKRWKVVSVLTLPLTIEDPTTESGYIKPWEIVGGLALAKKEISPKQWLVRLTLSNEDAIVTLSLSQAEQSVFDQVYRPLLAAGKGIVIRGQDDGRNESGDRLIVVRSLRYWKDLQSP